MQWLYSALGEVHAEGAESQVCQTSNFVNITNIFTHPEPGGSRFTGIFFALFTLLDLTLLHLAYILRMRNRLTLHNWQTIPTAWKQKNVSSINRLGQIRRYRDTIEANFPASQSQHFGLFTL